MADHEGGGGGGGDRDRDRISDLPDEIIIHILSFMPMKSAAQTGSLSSRWRHLWKFNPVLDFQIKIPRPFSTVDCGFVNRCLRLYKAPAIRNFTVVAELDRSYKTPDIESWVDFAIAKQVRFLEFYWWIRGSRSSSLKLPNSFYDPKSNGSLEQVVLSSVDFSPPVLPLASSSSSSSSGFMGFASLKKLTLFHSKLTDETLRAIMTTCLVLESLALRFCPGLVNVKVSSKALKEFEFYRVYPLWEPTTMEVSVPNLVTLKILLCSGIIRLHCSCPIVEATLFEGGIRGLVDDSLKSNARKLLTQLKSVELLAADRWILHVAIGDYYTSGNRCTLFRNVKEFYFVCSDMTEEYMMVMFLAFLEDCPLLEKLRIDFRRSCWSGIHKKLPTLDCKISAGIALINGRSQCIDLPSYFVKLDGGEQLPQVGFLHRLKSIELLYFSGYKCEMELAKRLLEKTASLETLYLVSERHYSRLNQEEVTPYHRELLREQMNVFTRASPEAQILIT